MRKSGRVEYVTSQPDYDASVCDVGARVSAILRPAAAQAGVSFDGFARDVFTQLNATADARAVEWRARVWLYDASSPTEPLADSDSELDPRHPGTSSFLGLPAVAEWIMDLAAQFHGRPTAGMTSEALRRKIKTARSQMSQRGNNTCTIRCDYEVLKRMPGDREVVAHYSMRCDIVRADKIPEEFRRAVFDNANT